MSGVLDTGLGRWPSSSFAINTAWITTAAARRLLNANDAGPGISVAR